MSHRTAPTQFPLRPDGVDEVEHDWKCPVCGTPTPIRYRPGRARVYCTNACKQRAYRWRRDNGIRLLVTPWKPAERSHNSRTHAVRPADDVVGEPRDHRERNVAVCGAFARRPSAHPAGHTEFTPGSPRACRSCTRLTGADPAWFEEYPVVAYDERQRRWVYNPPAARERLYAARRGEHGSAAA
jgi:hypothetical protein